MFLAFDGEGFDLLLEGLDFSFISLSFLLLSWLSCAKRCFWDVISMMLLFMSWIFTLYSLMVISNFSHDFFIVIFSWFNTSMWAKSSEISVDILDFSLTTFSLVFDMTSICSCNSIIAS